MKILIFFRFDECFSTNVLDQLLKADLVTLLRLALDDSHNSGLATNSYKWGLLSIKTKNIILIREIYQAMLWLSLFLTQRIFCQTAANTDTIFFTKHRQQPSTSASDQIFLKSTLETPAWLEVVEKVPITHEYLRLQIKQATKPKTRI